MDPRTKPLLGIVGGILVIASITGAILSRRCRNDAAASTIANLKARIRSWWVMAGIFSATILLGSVFTTVLFALLSFLAMREFITLNRTGRADHEILFWAFFVILPLPYFLVGIQWYGLFAIFIPVYAFVFIPIRRVLTGESKNFLMSTARTQWALLICVDAVSHMPMLLAPPLRVLREKTPTCFSSLSSRCSSATSSSMSGEKPAGNKPVAPGVSPHKTREGTVGGIASTVLVSTALWWATPLQSLADRGDGAAHLPRGIFRRTRPLGDQTGSGGEGPGRCHRGSRWIS